MCLDTSQPVGVAQLGIAEMGEMTELRERRAKEKRKSRWMGFVPRLTAPLTRYFARLTVLHLQVVSHPRRLLPLLSYLDRDGGTSMDAAATVPPRAREGHSKATMLRPGEAGQADDHREGGGYNSRV